MQQDALEKKAKYNEKVAYDTSKKNAELMAKNNALEDRVKELESALNICWKSLCTYGSHPIIQIEVNNALNKPTIKM